MPIKELTLRSGEVKNILNTESIEFPKYVSQILNLANQNAQGTRPRVVGQMSDLIQEFVGKTIEEWKSFYDRQRPGSIDAATDKIWMMTRNLSDALQKIDRNMVKEWVEDLVIVKTFVGLRFQEAILARVAESENAVYRLATPQEEAKGIDGFIGAIAVSIKPDTYEAKASLPEIIEHFIIWYEKTKSSLKITWDFDA